MTKLLYQVSYKDDGWAAAAASIFCLCLYSAMFSALGDNTQIIRRHFISQCCKLGHNWHNQMYYFAPIYSRFTKVTAKLFILNLMPAYEHQMAAGIYFL